MAAADVAAGAGPTRPDGRGGMDSSELHNDVIRSIRERYETLSDSHQKVAEFVLDNLEVATFLSLNELSARIGVSDATLIRFAQEMGFTGFKEFREHLADFIRKIIYSRKPHLKTPGKDGESGLLDTILQADINYLQNTLAGIDRESFRKFIGLLQKAERIFCMGWRASSFLAEFLAFQLKRLDYEASAMVRERRTLLEQVFYLKKGDVLVVFDQWLYATEVFQAVEYLKRNRPEVPIVTFTNDPLAGVVQYADLSFFIDLSGQRDFSILSLTAPMCLINAVVEGVFSKNPQKARDALQRYEDVVLSKKEHAMVLGNKP